jgi:hypothetical protein
LGDQLKSWCGRILRKIEEVSSDILKQDMLSDSLIREILNLLHGNT